MSMDERKFSQKFFRYTSDGEYIEYPTTMGLASIALTHGQSFKVKNCENHPDYNGLIDVHTSMPVTIVPILCSITEEIVGVLEIINPSASKYQSYEASFLEQKDNELIDFLTGQLSQIVKNRLRIEMGHQYITNIKYKNQESDLKGSLECIESISNEREGSI